MASQHIIYAQNLANSRAIGGTFIAPENTTSGDYGKIHGYAEEQAKALFGKNACIWTNIITMYSHCVHDGIYWGESYSCSGCHFTIVQFLHQSDQQVEQVKSYLYRQRDVTGITVVKLEKLLNAKDILSSI